MLLYWMTTTGRLALLGVLFMFVVGSTVFTTDGNGISILQFCLKGVAVNKRLVRQKWWIILAIFLYIHGSFLRCQIIGPAQAGLPDLLLHLCACISLAHLFVLHMT